MVMISPEKIDRRRSTIKVPDGDTVESLVRHGMCLKVKNPHEMVGLHYDTYRFVRKLLLLQDSPGLSEYELAVLKKAIALINVNRQLIEARKLTHGIVKRHWSGRTRNGRSQKELEINDKTKRRFEKMLFLVKEVCTNNDEIALPLLKKVEKEEAIKDLRESIGGLFALINRLEKDKGGDGHE